jgi:hypothetical protein
MKQIRKKLGDVLLDARKINASQLEQALQLHKSKKIKLGEALIELGFVSEIEIIDTVSKQLSINKGCI